MAAGIYNDLLIEQGSTFSRTLELKRLDDNSAINLTGYTFTGKIRRTPTSGDVIQVFTCVVSSPATNGEVVISLTAAQTAALPVSKNSNPMRDLNSYSYDIESVSGGGEVVRWIEGVCKISPEVTR